MPPAKRATILHADLDAFYASVEQLLDPTLRGLPVAVGGGVVLAASYEARAYGIGAGMPGWRARKLCPDLRFVGGHFREYQELADAVMAVFADFTPWVERISIDEAFLDVRGAVHLFGSARLIASTIRDRVRSEIGLPVSIGVARTKHLAKIASQVAKPDGLVIVDPDDEQMFLRPLPVGLMWGVGPVVGARLAAVGVRTIGDLAAVSSPVLERLLGSAVGAKLGALAVNRDPRRIETSRRSRSVGAQSALGRQRASPLLIRTTLAYLADRIAGRLRAGGYAGRTVTVRVRFVGLKSVTRSATLAAPIATTLTLTQLATELATRALDDHPDEAEITLLGISVSGLVLQSTLPLELPFGHDRGRPGQSGTTARWAVDRSVDAIRSRFGRDSVGFATTVFARGRRGEDGFRELAERDGLG